MRTLVDLPVEHLQALDRLAQREKASRAELIRRAVARWIRAEDPALSEGAFGIWRRRKEDALRYEDRVRSEWARK